MPVEDISGSLGDLNHQPLTSDESSVVLLMIHVPLIVLLVFLVPHLSNICGLTLGFFLSFFP